MGITSLQQELHSISVNLTTTTHKLAALRKNATELHEVIAKQDAEVHELIVQNKNLSLARDNFAKAGSSLAMNNTKLQAQLNASSKAVSEAHTQLAAAQHAYTELQANLSRAESA